MSGKRISSGSPFERSIGFSRAIRTGNRILVSGTAPISEDGSTAFPGDVSLQTRVYLCNADTWKEVGKAHSEFFGSLPPH